MEDGLKISKEAWDTLAEKCQTMMMIDRQIDDK